MNDRAKAILDFWFDDMVVEKRFKRDDNFDQLIRDKFKDDHEKATLNEYDDWQDEPLSTLALVILLDQFSRNLYRDDKKAFEFYKLAADNNNVDGINDLAKCYEEGRGIEKDTEMAKKLFEKATHIQKKPFTVNQYTKY